MSFSVVSKDGSHSRVIFTSLDQIAMTIGYPGVGGDLPVVMTPEVVSELVPEAVVAGGAGLLGHGEGESVLVGVEVAHPAPGQPPGYQRRGVRGVPQGEVRPLHVPEGGQDAEAALGVRQLLQGRLLAAKLGQADRDVTVSITLIGLCQDLIKESLQVCHVLLDLSGVIEHDGVFQNGFTVFFILGCWWNYDWRVLWAGNTLIFVEGLYIILLDYVTALALLYGEGLPLPGLDAPEHVP